MAQLWFDLLTVEEQELIDEARSWPTADWPVSLWMELLRKLVGILDSAQDGIDFALSDGRRSLSESKGK
jgi:hypothetical protein